MKHTFVVSLFPRPTVFLNPHKDSTSRHDPARCIPTGSCQEVTCKFVWFWAPEIVPNQKQCTTLCCNMFGFKLSARILGLSSIRCRQILLCYCHVACSVLLVSVLIVPRCQGFMWESKLQTNSLSSYSGSAELAVVLVGFLMQGRLQ